MSCNYAEGLSPYADKGKLGLPEQFDPPEVVDQKVEQLYQWIINSGHTVFYTGAGISTSAGIPDFRGPKGVWTLEKKGLKPDINISWDDAKPTKSHMAIAKLVEDDKAKFVVSQNIDGLHIRSGLPRHKLAELHGDMFIDCCNTCKKMIVRQSAATTVGQKCLGTSCPSKKANGRCCRGKLCDFVLDWEAELPDVDLDLSNAHSILSELSIVIGSTLQIIPAGTMPTLTKKYHGDNGKLVIINLQPTKFDKKADLIIRCYSDNVIGKLFEKLGMDIPEYDSSKDPIVKSKTSSGYIDWTLSLDAAKEVEKLAEEVQEESKQKNKNKKKEIGVTHTKGKKEVLVKNKTVENEAKNTERLEIKEEMDGGNGSKDTKKLEIKMENGDMKIESTEEVQFKAENDHVELKQENQKNLNLKAEVIDKVDKEIPDNPKNGCSTIDNSANVESIKSLNDRENGSESGEIIFNGTKRIAEKSEPEIPEKLAKA